jgi:hypothetical protein
MKKTNYFLSLLIGGAIALTSVSCNDDNDSKPTVVKPDNDDKVGPVLQEIRDGRKQHFTLNISTGGSVKGEEGTRVEFPANSLVKLNGAAVTGSVDIELIEIYKKSDMLFSNMPTIGLNDENKMALLISGGEFYINAKQNGEQLKVDGGFTINAPTAKTGGDDTDMRVFKGAEECDNDGCDVVWEQQERDMRIGKDQDGTGGAGGGGSQSVYQVFQNQFGWTNIDRWYSDPRPKTTIFVDVPEGYDNTNCAVYLSYDGETSALASFDTYNATTALFTEHYGLIPIGLQVHFIMISVIDDVWYYSIHPATITTNHVETFTTLTQTTEAELSALVDALP